MPASSVYQLVEPHPHATTTYIHTARGGAGNIANASSITDGSNATGPASRHPFLWNRKRPVFTSGRGGMGNLRSSSERTIFSFDEELEREMRQMQDLAPVCHVGRGGAGNKVYNDGPSRREQSSDSESVSSNTSAESGALSFNRRLRKRWGKMTELF